MGTPHGAQAGQPVCARHTDRPTGLSCTRCGRPSCPQCLVEASVGYQCVDCVNEGGRTVRRATTVAGAEAGAQSVLVPALIAVNVAMYVITAALAGSVMGNQRSAFFSALVEFSPLVAAGEFWRLITHGFLHYGPVHLLVNMVSLWFLRDVETVLGRARFAVLYLMAMLGGSVADFLFGDGRPLAGASGAIYGLLGAFVVIAIRLKRAANPWQLVLMVLGLLVVTSLVIPNVSLLAHAGGLVVGAGVAFAFAYAPPARRVPFQVGAVALIAVALVGLVLFRQAQLLALF
ncbi:rhomboid family intramembrane serine protease [Actinokineospora sp. 24-640]